MLSLVHLIYMAGDKCMRQNACFSLKKNDKKSSLCWFSLSFVMPIPKFLQIFGHIAHGHIIITYRYLVYRKNKGLPICW